MFSSVTATPEEVATPLPGDDLVPGASVVMDRAFSLAAPVEEVWPWFAQLGKHRAGWYLPRSVERLLPRGRRAIRTIDPQLQGLAVGHVIDDWGGKDATFEVALLDPPHTLVHTSTRGRTDLTWAIVLSSERGGTRVRLRLRLGEVKHRRLAATAGDFFDAATVAGLAAGLAERVGPQPR